MKRTMKSESGRSMVEILGVLAIIGVLSIGGIAGYIMAMNRFRANEAIDIANKMASLAFAANQTSIARTGNALTTFGNMTPHGFGLIPNSTNNGSGNMLGGGKVTVTAITQEDVTINMVFLTEGVCTAANSILGTVGTCTNKTISHAFRQS